MTITIRIRSHLQPLTITANPDDSLLSLINTIKTYPQFESLSFSLRNTYPNTLLNDLNLSLRDLNISHNHSLFLELNNSQPNVNKSITPTTTSKSTNSNSIAIPEGIVSVRVMLDDNSCLFTSIANVDKAPELRKLVSKIIKSNTVKYSQAILGKQPDQYCTWIENNNSWGGAIELSIFSEFFKTELCSVDIATGRKDIFGEGAYSSRAYLFYRFVIHHHLSLTGTLYNISKVILKKLIASGIHYDAVALSPSTDSPPEFDQVLFQGEFIPKMDQAVSQLATTWKKLHKFTDTANFTLKCSGLVGENSAQKHANETGHAQFVEYS
ncbi:hypothetical protein HDV02_000983 [Globomyces sp. JEL0801]|nr:hypothetical protein HDV02_000983 [Globomyces sp. JEL0801]